MIQTAAIIQDTLNSVGEIPLSEILQNKIQVHAPEGFRGHDELFLKLREELEGLGPLCGLLKDSEISEILVNDFSTIYIERNGTLFRSECTFSTELTYMRIINRLLLEIEKIGDMRHPLIDGVLRDGTRIHISLPPITKNPTLSIRKHTARLWGLLDLKEQKMFSSPVYSQYLKWIVERKNILICGPTGSGKTTLLRAFLKAVSHEERVVVLEDTPEIGPSHPHLISLCTRSDLEGLVSEINLSTLLKNALRMRPDRIVVGEVRGEEALILLDALATGHKGSMSSLHAGTPDQALRRLESLVSRAAPQWPISSIRQLIKDSIDVIIVLEKKNGLRVHSQAAEISSIEGFGFLLNPL